MTQVIPEREGGLRSRIAIMVLWPLAAPSAFLVFAVAAAFARDSGMTLSAGSCTGLSMSVVVGYGALMVRQIHKSVHRYIPLNPTALFFGGTMLLIQAAAAFVAWSMSEGLLLVEILAITVAASLYAVVKIAQGIKQL